MERKRILLLSDLHYCQEEYGGISRDEKALRLVSAIQQEHEKEPVEMILFLGDYSLDHWAWKTLGTWLVEGKSYTKQFVERYAHMIPVPYYMLAGNHEQFGQDMWREITGFDRSAHFVVGDYLIILWDSYGADLDPTEHIDGTYTPIDVAATRTLMAKYPDKKVILCSHSFQPTLSDEEAALIADERIVCLFQGHTHQSDVRTLPVEYGSKKLIQTGSWAYTTPSGSTPCGMRELYLETGKVRSSYIVPQQTICNLAKPYTVAARHQDEIEITL